MIVRKWGTGTSASIYIIYGLAQNYGTANALELPVLW